MEPHKHKIFKNLKLAGLASLMFLGLFNMVLLFSGAFLESSNSFGDKMWPSFNQTTQEVDTTGGEDSLAGYKSYPVNDRKVETTDHKTKKSKTSSARTSDEVSEENQSAYSSLTLEYIEKLYQGFAVTVAVGHQIYSCWTNF